MFYPDTEKVVPKKILRLLLLYALSSLIIYFSLHCKYRIEDTDDAWTLSYYYNYYKHNITFDLIGGYPNAGGGVQCFRKTCAWIMIPFLNYLGWTKSNAFCVNIFFFILSLALWANILKKIGYERALILSFLMIAPLLDPFFSIANSARSDAFVFLLDALSFWCFIEKRYFFSMLAASVAVETHPMGVIVIFYIGAYLYSIQPSFNEWVKEIFNFKKYWPCLLGLASGILYYLLLHYDSLRVIPGTFTHEGSIHIYRAFNNLGEYYFETKYYRHLPELGILLVSIWIYLKEHLYRTERFIGSFLVFAIIFSTIMLRPNAHYAFYTYPAVLLFILRVFEMKKWLFQALIFFLALLIPQYGFVYIQNHDFDLNKQIEGVRAAVPSDNLPVIGGPNDWFAFYQREFYYYDYAGDPEKLGLKKFYLVDSKNYRDSQSTIRDWINRNFQGKTLSTLSLNGQPLSIWRMEHR